MHAVIGVCFISYYFMLFIGQQVIAFKLGARNIPRAQVLGMHYSRLVGMLAFLIGSLTLQRAETFTFPVIRLLGLLVVLAGLMITYWAQIELGKNWVGGVALHKGHKLITTGPYKWVRHPLYSGLLISGFGIGLLTLNIWFFFFSMFYNGSFALRMFAEEEMLTKKFKMKYERYMTETGALFPRIRK